MLKTINQKAIKILARSKMRWPGLGVSRLEESVIVYSVVAISQRQHRSRGVAVVISEKAAAAWRAAGLVFDPVSERMVMVVLTQFMSYYHH